VTYASLNETFLHRVIIKRRGARLKVQKLRIILVLITIGCILGPIGTVAIAYRNNLSQMIITPQLKDLLSGNNNNNNGNNNNNNNNNGNNNNNNNNNDGNGNPNNNNGNPSNSNNPNSNSNNNSGNRFANSGNVVNSNPTVDNPILTFGGSGTIAFSGQTSQGSVSDQVPTNINCLVQENGNNIGLSLDLTPQNVPSDLQSTFQTNNDYLFNFAGTTSSSSSGTQISASDQGGLNPGSIPFNINLSGSIDQAQDTLTFTLANATGGNPQAFITTPQAISLNLNNNNNGNPNNNNSPSPSNSPNGNNNNNNNSNGVNPTLDTSSSQINTATGKITLTFSITNGNSQDAKITKMGGTLINSNDQVTLGTVSLSSSVTISAGQTSQVVVSGTLTSQGKSDLKNNFAGDTSIDVEISGGSMTVNGVAQSNLQTQDIGNINLVS